MLAAVECAHIRPVASLQPNATKTLWQTLVRRRRASSTAATADCRPLRAVFYTATDWLRLATRLAANASPCAQYYVSIPSLAADHTQLRSDQAWRIRALGPNLHAMAEINMSAWGTWVSNNSSTWYEAGVEARRRMAVAGYDVTLGDTWAVNEFSSSVRRGDGTARADARDFVRGLYDGDGTLQKTKGVVFVIGIGQGTPDLSTYKTNLEGWLQDSAFWADMNAYVSDWSQELYGDFRNYGIAGASLGTRRDYLNDYLQHEIVLAGVGPDTIATARSYLQGAYTPLANAAWQWSSGFGWTVISFDQMENFVSAQTYALRYFSSTNSQPGDRWGFAWAPKNATGLTTTDFTTQSAAIIDRLAAAIHDSAQPLDPGDPGAGACGPLGQNDWCAGGVSGAWFNDAWKSFTTWALPPTTSSFAPTSGPVGTGVTITGSHFSGATAVAFNGAGASFTVDSDTQITATVPDGATSGAISVTTPGGTASSSTSFTVTPAPSITAFSPTSGPVGTEVTITGSNFTGVTAVAFDGTAASFTLNSDAEITAIVPSGATSGAISVTTPGGTAMSSSAFTVTAASPAPAISSFSPVRARAGTSVTIIGSGFTGATQVAFDGTAAPGYVVSSDGEVTATVPASATTGPISIMTPAGTAVSSKSLKIRRPRGTHAAP